MDTTTLEDAIAEAERAVRAATLIASTASVDAENAPSVENLYGAVSSLARELIQAGERYDREVTGMTEADEWGVDDVYTECSDTWGIEVVVLDDRDPVLEVDAPDALEANKRAATWAKLKLALPEAIVIDGAYHRRRRGGTKEVSPGRYRVTIEGW